VAERLEPPFFRHHLTRMKIIPELSPGALAQLGAVERFEAQGTDNTAFSAYYRQLILEYYRRLVPADARVLEIGCGEGDLLAGLPNGVKTGIDLSPERVAKGCARHPGLDLRVGAGETAGLPEGPFDVIILSDVLNQAGDIELLLGRLHQCSHPGTRLILNVYNTLWRPLLSLVRFLGLAPRQLPQSWLSRRDVMNLLMLAGWEGFKGDGRILFPLRLGPFEFVSRWLNRWLSPFFGWASLAIFIVARRSGMKSDRSPRVSVIIPARNEAGSIETILERMPCLGDGMELIFVEGHSKDGTWESIQSLPDEFRHGKIIKRRQTGEGKGNAVREGFRIATGDLFVILDADLTTPPEDLPKFVNALMEGRGDVANGVRLVYPMDGKAMQFANLCANKAFGMLFSWLLGQMVKDTLCGTKMLWASDYQRIEARRAEIGDFDPFGDFDLLLGADLQNLKIIDVPVRYAERFYGTTNISRWRHGVILLRGVVTAARKIKFV